MTLGGLGELAEQLRDGKEYHYNEDYEVPQDILKYWKSRYNIFSRYDEGVYLTDKSWFSITPEPVANAIAEQVAVAAPVYKTTLIDAFCGAGGNAIAFARSGRWDRIFAIDNDPEELKCAKKNAEIYGVSKKIFFIQGDCFEVIKKRYSKIGHETVLFASPPWGGLKYTSDAVFDLAAMQPYGIEALFTKFTACTPEVILYLPRSSDLNQIASFVEKGQQIDVIHYCMTGFSKAICAYYGAFKMREINSLE